MSTVGRKVRFPFGVTLQAGLALHAILFLVSGCGSGGIPPDRTTGTPTTPGTPGTPGTTDVVSGNWQINVAAAANSPFSALTGSILQSSAATNNIYSLTSVLHIAGAAPTGSYAGLTTLPATGSFSGTALSLTSFPLESQILTLNATTTHQGSTFSGPFSISGGTASGVSGTVSGQRITALSGSYTGSWQDGKGSHTVVVTPMQDTSADGFGYFHLSGTAIFGNVACFTTGTIDTASSITGQEVAISITASDGSSIILTGITDVAATTLTIPSVKITSGACGSTPGTVVLTH